VSSCLSKAGAEANSEDMCKSTSLVSSCPSKAGAAANSEDMCKSTQFQPKVKLQGESSVVSRFYEVQIKCWELLGYGVVYPYQASNLVIKF